MGVNKPLLTSSFIVPGVFFYSFWKTKKSQVKIENLKIRGVFTWKNNNFDFQNWIFFFHILQKMYFVFTNLLRVYCRKWKTGILLTPKGPLVEHRMLLNKTLLFQNFFDQKTRLACTGGLGAPQYLPPSFLFEPNARQKNDFF